MCGRIVQFESIPVYLEALSPQLELSSGFDPEPIAKYNVSPGTGVTLLHAENKTLKIEKAKWGYRPFWAKEIKKPPAINARVETAASKSYYRAIWKNGRAIVPANGWFEWLENKELKVKQPYFITYRSREPMFMAAIGDFKVDRSNNEIGGFVILTAESDKGMIDIHDRRPVVLSAAEANAWLDPETTSDMAEDIARNRSQPVDEFVWFPVSREVGKSSNQGSHLIEEIADPVA